MEGGAVGWLARSPDLTPLHFFLWGHVKSVVYINPANTREELIELIFTAFDQITVLACSPESDRHWHDDVKSVIRHSLQWRHLADLIGWAYECFNKLINFQKNINISTSECSAQGQVFHCKLSILYSTLLSAFLFVSAKIPFIMTLSII